MKMQLRIRYRNYIVVVASYMVFSIALANSASGTTINIPVSKEWGEAKFSEYTAINKTNEWRYTRQDATLIITQTECKNCKPVNQNTVDEYNNQKSAEMSALLLEHHGVPAMLRLYSSPKGVNFHVFQIVANGYQYEIQLGVNRSATSELSFKLQKELLSMFYVFKP